MVSTIEKHLGRIVSFTYGINSDGLFGAQIELSFSGFGATDSRTVGRVEFYRGGDGGVYYEPISREIGTAAGDHIDWLSKLLHDSKRRTIDKLAGTPIEVTTEDRMLKSWRVLTEVL